MKNITINGVEYEVLEDVKEAIDKDVLAEKLTDYFDDYDYVVGDWAYNKLRLKGFNDSNNPKCSKINDIKNLDKYIKNNCAYGCKWFKLKKIK